MMNAPRVIGMLGGMSWESSAQYYRLANELVRERLGGLHSARIVLTSVDFADIEALQVAGRWEEAGQLLAEAARGLEAAGAELLVICTNTMHTTASGACSRCSPRSRSPTRSRAPAELPGKPTAAPAEARSAGPARVPGRVG